MKKNICLYLFILVSTLANAQEYSSNLRKQFIFEDNIMIINWEGDFFPILNNEVSTIYGISNVVGLGLFYDYYHIDNMYKGAYFKGDRHIIGLKAGMDLLPVLSKDIQNRIPNLSISLNAYLGYNSNSQTYVYDEKKDSNTLANYYRLNAKYFIVPKFFISASTGVINSNRLFMGIGFKL